jgi:hypothetical protein
MMKKKNQKYFWIAGVIIAIAVIVLFVGNFEFNHSWSLKFNKPLAIGDVPTGCNVGGSGTTANEFLCPGICDVNGWDDCTTQTGEIPIVIFRTNAQSFEDYNDRGQITWVAINGIVSGNKFTKTQELHAYCITSTTGGSASNEILLDNNQVYPFNTRLYAYNGNLYVLTSAGINNEFRRLYKLCDDTIGDDTLKIATSLQSITSYTSRERFGGSSNPFQCSKDYTISNGGVVKSTGKAVYSSTTTGKYETGIKRLSKNDKIVFNGNINYAVIDTSNACVRDTCTEDKSGIIKCVKDSNGCPIKSPTITNCITGEFCTQLESTAVCEAPFEESMDLRAGFTTAEPITLNYGLKSTRVSNVFITFTLRNTNNRQQAIQVVGPTSLSLPITNKPISFTNPGLIGTYEIVVDKNYDGKSVQSEIYSFTIGNPLEITLKIPYSDLTGLKLIVGSQFYVDVGVSENGVLIPDLVTVNPKATITTPDGAEKTIIIPQYIFKNDYIRYYFTVGEPGRFKFTAKASKFGVETIEKETNAEIRVPKIDITYTNINQLTNTKPGLKTIKFETRDAFGDLFTTDYTVKIVPSGASTGAQDIDATSLVKVVEAGKYEFDYSFPAGAYIIKVKASSPGYPGFSELPSASINIDETGNDKQCGSSTDCPAGQTCNSSGQCVNIENPTWFLYAIVIGAILFAVVLLIIIVNLSRKKQKSVSIGGGL